MTNIPESTNKKFQVIILTLSDGRKIRATVPAFCEESDRLSIVDFQVTPPEELPADARWGKLFD